MKHPQFTLDLTRPDDTSPSAFARAPANDAAVRMIELWPKWPGPAIGVVGPTHSGKSHLALIWAERASARRIPLEQLTTSDLEAGLSTPLWDDRHADGQFDEDALFHLLNLAKEENGAVLLTSNIPPAKWKVALPDLASRLKALPVAEIGEPDDALLEAILIKRFSDLGIDAEPAVMRFLLARIERSYLAAHVVSEALGRQTLATHRRVTVPLAAETLEVLGKPD